MKQENNTDESNNSVGKNSKKNKKKRLSSIKIALLAILIAIIVGAVATVGIVSATIRSVPEIEASNIDTLLNQNSFILDQKGNIIEKVLAEENRTSESIKNMPDYLGKAFISIEDERFYEHFGVDIKGIFAALLEDIKARSSVRGASTITQQLAKNVYLTNEKSLKRKIKEAYIAIKLEKQLNKDQILEAYLNKIYLGQGAYGVKEAAFTYFSKENLKDLTIAEAALIAGITKNPSRLSPYNTVKPQDVPKDAIVVGNVELLGKKYVAVFNEEAITRQKLILSKMKELGHITEAEYNEALEEDMTKAIKPGKKVFSDISSYFADYVKKQVVADLMVKKKISYEEAHRELLTGGFKIYSTVDLSLQKDIEKMYTNFSSLVFNGKKGSSWQTDGNGNIVNSSRNVVYYKRSNVLSKSDDFFIKEGDYKVTDNGLLINSPKLNVSSKNIDIKDYYTLENGHLVSHNIGSLELTPSDFKVNSDKNFVINKKFLNKNKSFYKIDAGNNLIISSDFFLDDEVGIVQPQSATVIIDHNSGELKALVGGRNLKGNKILNRALTPRQPGSAIKPIAAYLPALDNGYNAATGIDDVPIKNVDGKPWPRNSYSGYRGMIPVREAIRDSSNAASVKTIEDIGVKTSEEYLKKLGIISEDGKDSFITEAENKNRNDENSSALGLGGMTKGISPLDMAGAYATIANGGSYSKPIAYTKIEDRYGNIVLENKPKKTTVVSPGIAYVMTDMLRDVVTSGTGRRAAVPGVITAGKTGTTSDNTDAWFVGYTPQYTASIWIGNDSPAVKLPNGSALAAGFWSKVMTRVHRDVPRREFKEPEGMITASVCTISGKLPTPLCEGHVETELFAKGHEPTESCDIHESVRVDITTNKLATNKCPSFFVRSKSFMNISPPYIASKFGGILPSDYIYRMPTAYCTANHRISLPTIKKRPINNSDRDIYKEEEVETPPVEDSETQIEQEEQPQEDIQEEQPQEDINQDNTQNDNQDNNQDNNQDDNQQYDRPRNRPRNGE